MRFIAITHVPVLTSLSDGSDAVASSSKLVASAPSASQLQKHIITVHPWDDPHVSPDASQRDGNFTTWVKRRVKVNIAGLPPDYPYQRIKCAEEEEMNAGSMLLHAADLMAVTKMPSKTWKANDCSKY